MAIGRVKLLLQKPGTDPHTFGGRPSYFWKEMGHQVAYRWDQKIFKLRFEPLELFNIHLKKVPELWVFKAWKR